MRCALPLSAVQDRACTKPCDPCPHPHSARGQKDRHLEAFSMRARPPDVCCAFGALAFAAGRRAQVLVPPWLPEWQHPQGQLWTGADRNSKLRVFRNHLFYGLCDLLRNKHGIYFSAVRAFVNRRSRVQFPEMAPKIPPNVARACAGHLDGDRPNCSGRGHLNGTLRVTRHPSMSLQ